MLISPLPLPSRIPLFKQQGSSRNVGLSEMENNYVPRSKRIACIMCRKRKLKCNGKSPTCGTCSRLGYECAYGEGRKKSGPKGNYRKQLEARLGMPSIPIFNQDALLMGVIGIAQVETLLKAQGQPASFTRQNNRAATALNKSPIASEITSLGHNVDQPVSAPTGISGEIPASQVFEPAVETKVDESAGWVMECLGIEEPLPSRQIVDELYDFWRQPFYYELQYLIDSAGIRFISTRYIQVYQSSIHPDIWQLAL